LKNFLAKDLMVPMSEYATVAKGASLFEALLALEKAQEEFTSNRYSHRAVLVLDEGGQVVGKISQLAFLRAIEPRDARSDSVVDLQKFGFSPRATGGRQEKLQPGWASQEEMHALASRLKVEDCMQTPTEGERIDERASLETAIHHLTTGKHLSLLVTRGRDIVGLLRLSDVFAAVFHAMKAPDPTTS
jgi:CBS domain-containing protein